jgi:uncharacterized protein YgbK (DUF1537 family)
MSSASTQPEGAKTAWPAASSPVSSQPDLQPRVLVLADDLTGACDSALAFVKTGLKVSVSLSASLSNPGDTDSDVVAISTETRNLLADKVEQRLRQLNNLSRFPSALLFKKVDSAGRGNPGVEIVATAQIAGCAAVVYAPAFPAAGRTVLEGALRVRDVSGQDARLHLLSLIPAGARHRVALIPTQDAASLQASFTQALAAGKDIWLCDSQHQDDLRHIARAASTLPLRLLWAGAAGLAEAVAEEMPPTRPQSAPPQTTSSASGCTLLICGTAHPVTSLQMQRLAPHASALTFDGEASLAPSSCGFVQLPWHLATADAVRKLWQVLRQPDRPPVDSLVLTGGDTAAFVLTALQATSLRLCGEVEPGIPWGRIDDGLAQGCTIITKSGGFGNELSLNNAVDFCKRLRS